MNNYTISILTLIFISSFIILVSSYQPWADTPPTLSLTSESELSTTPDEMIDEKTKPILDEIYDTFDDLESLKKKERAIVSAERHGNKQSKTIKTSIWIDMYTDLVKLQGLEEQLKLAIQKRNQEHEKIK